MGLGANLLRDPAVVLEEHALQNGDFGRHATRRLEIRRTEHLLGVVTHAKAFAGDPILTGHAVARHRDVADTVFLAPRTTIRTVQDALIDIGNRLGITLAVGDEHVHLGL